MSDSALPLAAVLLANTFPADAHRPTDLAQRAISAARAAGATPVVIVLHDGASAPHDARVARVKPGAAWISAVRAGMALLTNTPARLALLWTPAFDDSDDAVPLVELVAAARRTGAAVTARDEHELALGAVIVARDAWLELLTLGEQGIQAVVARRGAHYLTVS